MAIFPLIGHVTRLITDTIHIDVEADSWDEAQSKAEQVLEVFPKGHELPGVPFCWLGHRDYETPIGVHISERIEEDGA